MRGFQWAGRARSQFVTSALGELGFLLGNGVQPGLRGFQWAGRARSQFVTSALGELGFLLGNGVQPGLCGFQWAGSACSQFVTCAFCELGFLLGNPQRQDLDFYFFTFHDSLFTYLCCLPGIFGREEGKVKSEEVWCAAGRHELKRKTAANRQRF